MKTSPRIKNALALGGAPAQPTGSWPTVGPAKEEAGVEGQPLDARQLAAELVKDARGLEDRAGAGGGVEDSRRMAGGDPFTFKAQEATPRRATVAVVPSAASKARATSLRLASSFRIEVRLVSIGVNGGGLITREDRETCRSLSATAGLKRFRA